MSRRTAKVKVQKRAMQEVQMLRMERDLDKRELRRLRDENRRAVAFATVRRQESTREVACDFRAFELELAHMDSWQRTEMIERWAASLRSQLDEFCSPVGRLHFTRPMKVEWPAGMGVRP